jgi:hypothetical protein
MVIKEFTPVVNEIDGLLDIWVPRLKELPEDVISKNRNNQNRTIRQILGHMIDSASNNLHRIVHLQYRESPLSFPNYATYGNNDRWIAIQNYQEEDRETIISLWKYSHLHLLHVIKNINPEKLDQKWEADEEIFVSLEEMVIDFLRHFKLHISEIEEIIPAE